MFSINDFRKILEEAAGFESELNGEEFAVTDLADMGFDSLNRLETASIMQRKLNIKLSDDEVLSALTAQDFINLVKDKQQ